MLCYLANPNPPPSLIERPPARSRQRPVCLDRRRLPFGKQGARRGTPHKHGGRRRRRLSACGALSAGQQAAVCVCGRPPLAYQDRASPGDSGQRVGVWGGGRGCSFSLPWGAPQETPPTQNNRQSHTRRTRAPQNTRRPTAKKKNTPTPLYFCCRCVSIAAAGQVRVPSPTKPRPHTPPSPVFVSVAARRTKHGGRLRVGALCARGRRPPSLGKQETLRLTAPARHRLMPFNDLSASVDRPREAPAHAI